jgi:hypothetical protein
MVGKDLSTEADVLSLSLANAFVLGIPKCWAVPCTVPSNKQSNAIVFIVAYLMVSLVLDVLDHEESVLVQNPDMISDMISAQVISLRAAAKQINLVFTTSEDVELPSWMRIRLQAIRHAVEASLVRGLNLMLDFSTQLDKVAAIMRFTMPQTWDIAAFHGNLSIWTNIALDIPQSHVVPR